MILVEQTLGNIASFAVGDRSVERVAIPSAALAKRVLRLDTSRGELGLRLERAALQPGEVVFADHERVVVVELEPDDVLVLRPSSSVEAFELGHLLGNRHLPAQWWRDEIVVPYDPALERALIERQTPFAREQRTLAQPFRHADIPHGDAS